MEVLNVYGGSRLQGEVAVPGAKNSVLKLMAAALLAEGTTTLTNVPDILDVAIMAELVRRLGCTVDHDPSAGRISIGVPAALHHRADYDLVRRMRASICVLGPLLSRCGEVDVALPGGDNIGSRGLDMHVGGLLRMGAQVISEHGYLHASCGRLHGARIWLDFPSVGATETILMAAVRADGVTVIDNAAREPEIVDICRLLVDMGAAIGGIGSSTLHIEGVQDLQPVSHAVVGDRIVAGTWAVAAVMTKGDVSVRQVDADHLRIAQEKLQESGAQVST
ncbi:MAG: UDP-N-acetylglucosamine 1-carboxyvinyltransferase, partial [Actinomycetales bacterium]